MVHTMALLAHSVTVLRLYATLVARCIGWLGARLVRAAAGVRLTLAAPLIGLDFPQLDGRRVPRAPSTR